MYTNDLEAQHTFISAATNKGYEVLVMDTHLSSHFVGKLEQTIENSTFARVDADTIDKLINKDEEIPSKLTDEEKELLKPAIEEVVEKTKFTVQFESMNETDSPMTIVQPEFMRRMKEMQATGGGGMAMFGGAMPDTYNLVVNVNHPIVGKMLAEKDAAKQKDLIKQTSDLALLSQSMLKGQELTNFINRSLDLI